MSAIDWSSTDWPGFALAVVLAVVSALSWAVHRHRARKAEARLITSRCRLLGNNMTIPLQYEITVHNGSSHPLRLAEIHFWDGKSWQLRLAKSDQTNDPVIASNDEGRVLVPATTTDADEFSKRYYIRYQDSDNRTWYRVVDAPDFLRRRDIKRIRKQFGSI
jgi:hypothetical protein